MHVKLKWAVHSLKTDRGVVSPETARMVAKLGSELGVSPEEIGRAWLDCMCELHDGSPTQMQEQAGNLRAETMAFPVAITQAIERVRNGEDRATFVKDILHEKFLMEDPVYAAEWLESERQIFAQNRLREERQRVIAKQSKRPERPKRPSGQSV